MRFVVGAFLFFLYTVPVQAAEVIAVHPEAPVQGEPVLVTIASGTDVKALTFNGKGVATFLYNGAPAALLGIDLTQFPREYAVRLTRADGEVFEKKIAVIAREKYEAPLGIPEKLGGNTPESEERLVASLARENRILLNLRTGTKAFWREPFRFPVTELVMTDAYGYTRRTGASAIAHKGTDFRAPVGTKVFSMNRGVVRLTRNSPIYGKTVVIDHGLGVQTMYMHLSKIFVNTGELVLPGRLIGFSGETGYAEGPHLHLTVRIGGVSIDPMKFLALLGNTDSTALRY